MEWGMCLCDLLMSSTLHYSKMHTHSQTHTDTHNTLSSKWTVENICDQSLALASWVLRLHETSCQRGTWESLSRANSLRPLFSVFFFFFCCFVCLFVSHSLYAINLPPPPHTHTHARVRCKHKRSQYVGCNEYVTWRPDSRSPCFLALLMWQLR